MLISFYYILFFHYIFCEENENKIIFTMIHFRHGARASTFGGNVDFMGEYWEHPGEITSVGERMHYILGLRNRKRYFSDKHLLSEKYNSSELQVISTGYSRTIISALSHLQGLYPQKQNLGEILNDNQKENSFPPINIDEEMKNIIDGLKNDALPDSMTLIPIEIKNSSSFITFFARNKCQGAIKASNTSNNENMDSIVNKFNDNFGNYINAFKKIPENYRYNFTSIAYLCDTYIACYTDGRGMEKFKNSNPDIDSDKLTDLYKLCLDTIKIYFSEYAMRKDEIFYLEGSKIMELLINNTKRSIKADINNDTSSYPKMLIYSGHDITVSKQILFLLKAFQLDINLYELPTYATQIAFEISRINNGKKENRNYSDYYVNYYFKDELQLNVTADEFINKIENHIWSDEKIDSFCEYNTSNKLGNNIYKTDVNNNYKTPFLIFACLFSASIVANFIFLGIIFKNSNKKIHMKSSSFAEIKNA